MERYKDIRYTKLHFVLVINEDTTLPKSKASALRGGMGEMLLRMHCIRDRKCEVCDFESECLVRRTLYSKMEIHPPFMSRGDSVGYVLECENYETRFSAGDELKMNLLLFGKTIVYFSQFLQALHQLGVHGLGKHRSRFDISQITNSTGENVLYGTDILMENVKVVYLSDYINYRKQRIMKKENAVMRLVLHTPLSLKYRGEQLECFNSEAVMEACARRLYVMNCFEGIASEQENVTSCLPHIVSQESRPAAVRRYSSTHNEKIQLNGFYGHADLERIDEAALNLLLAGELMHVGKNTSFGFGRYSVISG